MGFFSIFLLAYVPTFSGQFYFWGNCFFSLLQSNYFDLIAIFPEQLFLQCCYFIWGVSFFRTVTSSQQPFFQNSYFFSRAKLLPSSHFLRIGSSLGQVLFRTPTFLVQKLFKIKTFSEEVLFQPGTSAQLFQKSYYFEKANFSEKQYSVLLIFLGWLFFQSGYFLKIPYFHSSYFFRKAAFSQHTLPEDILFRSDIFFP